MWETVNRMVTLVHSKCVLQNIAKSLSNVCCLSNKLCQAINDVFGKNNLNANTRLYELETILDYLHDELNTGHWTDVPLVYRHAFTVASFLKCVYLLLQCSPSAQLDENVVRQKCIHCVDMGLLLGAPLYEHPHLLTTVASILNETYKDENNITENSTINEWIVQCDSEIDLQHFIHLDAIQVDSLNQPSLQTFYNDYYAVQKPLKLTECISHWPAYTKWQNIDYLLRTAGDRNVPVEIGSNYAADDWSQKIMTIRDFIHNHYFSRESDKIAYLAQHNLFDQIPELKRDILIPEYCCFGTNEPDINAWFGPKGTLSPLHQDPKDNIFVQVCGTKRVLLFAPTDAPYLHPHQQHLLSNTAQVDPLNPDLVRFPQFPQAKMYKCLLKAGDMLFIPKYWWHHVTALTKSFSVSFWW